MPRTDLPTTSDVAVTAPPATLSVLGDVAAERAAQDARWGPQAHPDGTGSAHHLLDDADRPTFARLCALQRDHTDATHRAGRGTWRDILLEEVLEALEQDDPVELRAELVQVASVAAAWAEAIDRRAVTAPPVNDPEQGQAR